MRTAKQMIEAVSAGQSAAEILSEEDWGTIAWKIISDKAPELYSLLRSNTGMRTDFIKDAMKKVMDASDSRAALKQITDVLMHNFDLPDEWRRDVELVVDKLFLAKKQKV